MKIENLPSSRSSNTDNTSDLMSVYCVEALKKKSLNVVSVVTELFPVSLYYPGPEEELG